MMGRKLTSEEAARVLGVSEASVKRWAERGLLPTEKTAGGHRRFRPEDVAVVRRGGLGDAASAALRQRVGNIRHLRRTSSGRFQVRVDDGAKIDSTRRRSKG
jgi:excisionase family DNA binding protein